MADKLQQLTNAYITGNDDETIRIINENDWQPGDFVFFSSYVLSNKLTTVQAILAKVTPIQSQIDECFFGSLWQYPAMLDLLMSLKPSPEAMGRLVSSTVQEFQADEAYPPELERKTPQNFDLRWTCITRLMDAGAQIQSHQYFDLLRLCKLQGKLDLMDKYYHSAGLEYMLLLGFGPQNGNLGEYALTKPFDRTGKLGLALLEGAMMGNRQDLFDATLDQVADLHYCRVGSQNALNTALLTNNPYFVQALIARGARSAPDFNSLAQAISYNCPVEIIQSLVELPDTNLDMNDGEALILAVTNNNIPVTQLLLERGAKPNPHLNAPMKLAIRQGLTEIRALLNQYGASEPKPRAYFRDVDLHTLPFEACWQLWLQYYREHFPQAQKALLQPVPAADLTACEAAMQHPLADELRTIYTHCTSGEQLFFGMQLLSPTEILQAQHLWRDIDFVGKPENDQHYPTYPPESIKPFYINLDWFLFANDLTANYLSIDFDPGPMGKPGQIINSGRDQWERFVVADSITNLARKVLTRIKNEQTEVTPEGYFNLVPEAGGGFLYDVLNLVKKGEW